ncbi:sigma-70 family RNA polymerase sigma factor [Actinacidiphila sp. bgisy160]|uniref:sigma-70 family RNA polymerase sigma factor n=1 Tax=Actinacidiphila sp. bgisy160 TaxID=3413796 RepID=UPI003D75E071
MDEGNGESGPPTGAGADSGGGPPSGRVPGQREPLAERVPEAGDIPGAQLSDADLVARVRGGDDSAYEELYRRHVAAVRRYARGCCRDRHTAEDLTGEVFARTLQAIRSGSGPDAAVRAYLLTTVRRVAASWGSTAKREQLVDDFAVFAVTSAGAAAGEGSQEPGADVRAMHEAERSLAIQAFRTLPERWQAVLWHTAVEEESPSKVAPLLGLSANATAVLAHRAREGLRQAYLQAHVSSALTAQGSCARYADRLGAHARGGLRMRADRELRKHLEECAKCRLAAAELADVNAALKGLLPVAVVGWFGAAYAAKAAGVAAGGAVAGAGAGAVAAATSGGGAGGGAAAGAGGAVAAEGAAAPVKIAVAAGLALAAAGAVVAIALTGDDSTPRPQAESRPSAAPVVPAPAPTPPPSPSRRSPAPSPTPPVLPPVRAAAPTPTPPARPVEELAPAPTRSEPPAPSPSRTAEPPPTPTPAPEPTVHRLSALEHGVLGRSDRPTIRLGDWVWQRWGLGIDGTRYSDGVTVGAPSTVTIDLNRSCTAFDAVVGIDDIALGFGAARFSVHGDNGWLWRSEVLRGGDPGVPVHVPIAGNRSIRLQVEPTHRFQVVNVADWAVSRITCD